ncbi:hypothetical protein H0H93_001325, partial [Arthromyces matolae]
RFHRRNPRFPHPPRFQLENPSPPPVTSLDNIPTRSYHPQRSRSPSPRRPSRSAPYEPPSHTTLRSGRVAHPPQSKDYADSVLKKG